MQMQMTREQMTLVWVWALVSLLAAAAAAVDETKRQWEQNPPHLQTLLAEVLAWKDLLKGQMQGHSLSQMTQVQLSEFAAVPDASLEGAAAADGGL